MNVKETYRYFLFNGMSSMLRVSCNLFTVVGNGSEWIDGELCFRKMSDWYEPMENPVKPEDRNKDYLRQLNNAKDLQYEAYLIRRRFVIQKMEIILDSPIDSIIFEKSDVVRSHYVLNPAVEYAKCIVFPDDIKPDWAEAVLKFNEWWLTNLNRVYGVDTDFWPSHVKEASRVIAEARKKAFKIVNGIDYDEYWAKKTEEILGELE
jgi:hypothetical protein